MEKYIIFSYSEVDKINFQQVLEESPSTLRISSDGLLSIVKWRDVTGDYYPDFISALSQFQGPFTQNEMINLLQTQNWNDE